MTFRILDAYCCEGGGAVGYHRVGFEVFGVDLFRYRDAKGRLVGHNQNRYPFPSHQGDAVEYIKQHGHEFDAIHASPPCQHASAGTRAGRSQGVEYVELIEPTREALEATGKPYVIENVSGAALHNPITLCGTMFGLVAIDEDGTPLEMWRHRLFESNVKLTTPYPCRHGRYADQVAGAYGGARRDKVEARHVRHGGYVPSKQVQMDLLDINWMTEKGMHQALPPVYTQWIGGQLLERLKNGI